METQELQQKINIENEKLKAASLNGNYEMKQKIQHRIRVLNYKLEIARIKQKIEQLG